MIKLIDRGNLPLSINLIIHRPFASGNTDFTPRRILKLTEEEAARNWEQSDVYDCLVMIVARTVFKNVAHTRVTERRVPELIPVLGSQPAGDASHKPGGRLPLLSARLAVTPATLKRAATNFAGW